MNRETLKKAQKLESKISDTKYSLRVLNMLENCIVNKEELYLTNSSMDDSIEIPLETACKWMETVREEKEARLNDLEKEFEEL